MANFTAIEWLERIRQGQRFQKVFAQCDQWDRYKRYYRHNFPKGTIPVNIVFSYLRSMVPQIYLRNPKVTIVARKPGIEGELHARIVQSLANWLLKELSTKYEMKKMIQDSFLCGTASGFYGYDSLFGMDPSKMDAATGQYSLTQFDKKGYRTEFNADVNPGMPWFLRARPEDVIYPWGCESARNAEWVAMRVLRPLDDVKADPKYKNTKDIQGTFVPLRTGPQGESIKENYMYGAMETSEKRQWLEMYQIHDARTGKILVVSPNSTDFLRDQPDELQIDGLPVESMSFNPDPDYVYGIPDARIIEPQLLELNEIRTQAMKHRRTEIVKMIVKKGVFTEEQISKMTDEQVGAVIEAEIEMNLRDAVVPLTPGVSGILQDLAGMGEIVRGDVRESIGFSRNAGGDYQGKTHISAQETKQVSQALNIRLDERRDMVTDLLERVVRRFTQFVFTYWTQERVSRIVGPDGANYWVKYTGQQIKDEYDIDITPEEGQSLDSKSKFDMAIAAAEAWAKMNAGAVAQGTPVPAEIQRMLFSQFQGTGLDIDRLLMQNQQVAQQTQQLLAGAGQSQNAPVGTGTLAQAMQQGQR